MKTNINKLPSYALYATVSHPTLKLPGYWVGTEGKGRILMGPGGIVYSHKIGDSCMDIAGDHIEPGVSIKNPNDKENGALVTFGCVGNTVEVLSGDAKGAKGIVTGFHGGVDHTLVYFEDEVLQKLTPKDSFMIKAIGQGMELLDHKNIQVMSMDPRLLEALDLQEKNGKLEVPVTTIIPAHLMGAGIGETTLMSGDYDIMTQDKKANETYHLNDLRFGDFVYIQDHNAYNGAQYKEGSGTFGIVVHSDSFTNGHGPGVCVLMTSETDALKPRLDKDANLIHYIKKIS